MVSHQMVDTAFIAFRLHTLLIPVIVFSYVVMDLMDGWIVWGM